MTSDPILDELHAVRAKIAERFGGNLEKLFEHLAAEERRCGHPLISRPPRPATTSRSEPKPDKKSDAA